MTLSVRELVEVVKDAYGNNYAESFYQPVNPGVNPDALVDIVDIDPGRYTEAQLSTPQDLLRHIKSFIGKEAMLSADAKALLEVSSNSKAKHLMRSSKAHQDRGVRGAALLSLDDVVRNSVLIGSFPNQKEIRKRLINVHRFYVPVRVNGELYTLRLVAHEMKDKAGLTPIRADLYD